MQISTIILTFRWPILAKSLRSERAWSGSSTSGLIAPTSWCMKWPPASGNPSGDRGARGDVAMRFKQITLENLCERVVVGHVGPSSKYRDPAGVPFLMGKNIGPGLLKLKRLERVSRAFHEREVKSQLHPGDIVVVRIGESGQAALIPEDIPEANCSGLVIIKKPLEMVHPPYLIHYLNSPLGRAASLREAKGSTRSTLNTSSISQASIPLPPLGEQRRIAAILDRADQVVCFQREAVSIQATFSRCLFVDLFGDPRSMPRI